MEVQEDEFPDLAVGDFDHPTLETKDDSVGEIKDTKISLSAKQRHAKFKKEAELLIRMASTVDLATFNVLFDHLTYMKQVAGGTGNPAILSEFHRVPLADSRGSAQPKPREVKDRKTAEGVAEPTSNMDVDTTAIEAARSIREPAPIAHPGKRQKTRHKNAIETHRKEKKERRCLICQQVGHNQKRCPVVRQFGGMLTNELWEGNKWKALLPLSQRNLPPRSNGLRSGVVAVVLKEVIVPVSPDLEQQWVYVETYNPLEQQMKEAIVQASTLATWSKRGTSSKKRCYFIGEDRRLLPEDNTTTTIRGTEKAAEQSEEQKATEQSEESSESDSETGALMSQVQDQPKRSRETLNEDSTEDIEESR